MLEVAVGTGLAFEAIVRRSPHGRNFGIEISQGMLARARTRLRAAGHSRFELSRGTALKIDEPDASFDVVLNNDMFDLLDEGAWPRALGEFRRVLRPAASSSSPT